jgi:hypothetical protein
LFSYSLSWPSDPPKSEIKSVIEFDRKSDIKSDILKPSMIQWRRVGAGRPATRLKRLRPRKNFAKSGCPPYPRNEEDEQHAIGV